MSLILFPVVLDILLGSCCILPVSRVGMSVIIVQRLLGFDMVDMVTSDRMGDEYAKSDCEGTSC